MDAVVAHDFVRLRGPRYKAGGDKDNNRMMKGCHNEKAK
jgi:hypothetical protein